ncbi:efflux RND transporter periplasmic adaptor subunit [Kineosporia babensis]|uniref:Efflux RND transporter periplasmic adaptor subunit n=1 Tax=Kineosporia babensis TaxID=499548 RepID=A0A9X1NM25_9ACTN|nr:efflux RND transporter periplasmic adaptor subunit [Kineosporia babensis]MCD5316216.1 efflux RND transporter periplasmic adaptor subunit [Kineosporia babensis]
MFSRSRAPVDPDVFPSTPRARRTALWTTASIVVVVVIAAGSFLFLRPDPEPPATPSAPVGASAQIERRDLSTEQTLSGEVGYGTSTELSGRVEATVTWLPKPGRKIQLGQQLYRADDRPVSLFYGKLPLYRPIAGKKLVGRDVRLVSDNLSALGYDVGATSLEPVRDGKPLRSGESALTSDLVKAIKRWQEDTGRDVTGRVEIGDVQVQQGPVRVDSALVQVGASTDQPLLTVTANRKVVTVSASMSQAGSISKDDRATVSLPDGTEIPARVRSKGRTYSSQEGVQEEEQKLAVTIVVDKAKALKGIDTAEVQVKFVARTVKDALVVPVEALVSLREGGYAIQRTDDGGLVAVETGMFADGLVEITGDGLEPGLSVVVAS